MRTEMKDWLGSGAVGTNRDQELLTARRGVCCSASMKARLEFFIILLVCLGLPLNVFADAGTPLMWASMLHLLVGNLLIGLFEGFILAKLFSIKRAKSVGLLIAANYFSAWVGGLFLRGAIVRSAHMDLNNGWIWFWILVFATYVMTLILEWPFVALCLRGSSDWFKRSLKGNLVIQTISYVLLFGWYWMASGTSLYTQMHIVSPGEISPPESVLVYFIAERDGDVYERNLSGAEDRKVFELKSTNENDRLFVRQSSINTNAWDLTALIQTKEFRNPKLLEIRSGFEGQAAPDWRSSLDPPQYEDTWMNFGPTPRLGNAGTSDWKFWSGFWPIEGFHGTNEKKHTSVYLSFETPFGAWTVRNATHLPTDKVIFQLGEDQICILDPESKKIALLAHGRGPIAVIPENSPRQASPISGDMVQPTLETAAPGKSTTH